MEQSEGVLVYLKQLRVLSIGNPELFLFSAEEVWSARCQCSERKIQLNVVQQTFLEVVKNNSTKEYKNKSNIGITIKKEGPVC